jgi:ATP-dependent helicase/nuclease subunit A
MRLRQTATDVASAQYGTILLDVVERYGARYAALKDARGVLDFEDLQVNTRALLQGHPRIARIYRERFAEVMVDEFQDTNALQVSVIEALSGEALTSVGDEKQSIYGWRNADVEVFRRRAAALGPGRRFELPENYRSHPELVAFFNGLFTADGFWPDSFMQLKAGLSEPAGAEGPVAVVTALPIDRPRVSVTLVEPDACEDGGAPATEARAVAEYFAEMRAAGVAQGDMVLLLRSMTHVEVFEAAIRSVGFDVFVGSGGTFFDTSETEELEALLRAIANSADDEAFAQLLAGRMAALSDDSLYLLRQSAGRARTLWDAARRPDRPRLAEVDEAALERVIAVLERARSQRSALPLYDLLHDACEQLDYDLVLLAGGRPRAWANAMKFARFAGRYDEESAGDPAAFLEHLELRRAHKRYEQQAATAVEGVDSVRIMTVHGAKGLEFPVVAVAGLGSRVRTDRAPFDVSSFAGTRVLGVRLPPIEPFCKEARDSAAYTAIRELRVQRDLEEAKRILYVACTRASGALGLFGVTHTENEPDPSTPIGWLRTALAAVGEVGDRESALDGSEEAISVNGARVVVRRLLAQDAESGDRDAARAGEPADQGCLGPEAGAAPMPASGGGPEEAPAVDVPPPQTTRPPRRISYTGLKLFRTCGLRYYAGHVARLGSPVGADDASEALKVGSAVHAALCLCGPEGLPDARRLEAIARHAGVAPDGHSRVIEATEAFARSDLARRAYGAKVVLHEVPFGVVIGETILDGSIDLLAKQDEDALIVDYKTGFREPDASTIENWRLQSACYALAVLRSGSESVEVVFVQPEAEGVTVTFEYSSGDLETIESEIGGIIEAIGSGTFEALEEYDHDACAECAALGLLCAPRSSPRPRAAV